MRKHVRGQTIQEEPQDLLISGYPCIICRIINLFTLAISGYFNGLWRRWFFSFDEIQGTSTPKSRNNQGFPHQGIVSSQ
jgi:hypothetical protein